MVYKFREGRSSKVPAQVIGDELEKLGINKRKVTPSEVVDRARPKAAPLHPAFEWDNKIAGELYREDQARSLITIVEVAAEPSETEEESEERRPQIAFVSIGTSGRGGNPGYIAVATAMNDDDMRKKVIDDAKSQLRGWLARFRHLAELAGLISTVEQVLED